jgi:hypothetical protein
MPQSGCKNKPMKVCGDSATQYGESEKCIISFSPKRGDRTLQYSGNDLIMDTVWACGYVETAI